MSGTRQPQPQKHPCPRRATASLPHCVKVIDPHARLVLQQIQSNAPSLALGGGTWQCWQADPASGDRRTTLLTDLEGRRETDRASQRVRWFRQAVVAPRSFHAGLITQHVLYDRRRWVGTSLAAVGSFLGKSGDFLHVPECCDVDVDVTHVTYVTRSHNCKRISRPVWRLPSFLVVLGQAGSWPSLKVLRRFIIWLAGGDLGDRAKQPSALTDPNKSPLYNGPDCYRRTGETYEQP